MTTALQMANGLNNMAKVMPSNIRSVLYVESTHLLRDFKDRSAIDSGLFVGNWGIGRLPKSSRMFAGVSIFNRTPYAIYLDQGAEVDGPPWYYPGNRKKRSGKLIRRNGRVWAGGLNPGHSKTVGGIINPVIFQNERRISKLTNLIANTAIGGLK